MIVLFLSDVISTDKETKTSVSQSEKIEPPRCHGNACPCCGKCLDWRYDGDVDRDYECYRRDESNDIFDPKRWHRRPDGPMVTCSYFSSYHFGPTGARYGFDMCRCPSLDQC